jgi:hypothetical protein
MRIERKNLVLDRTQFARLEEPRAAPSPARPRPTASDAFEGTRPAASARLSAAYSPPPDVDITDPKNGGRPDFKQKGSACGTTSLAIALHRMGIEVPVSAIDDQIREFDFGASDSDIINYCHDRGLQADLYNQGSFETLKGDLAAGRQIMVMTDVTRAPDGKLDPGSPNDADTHYMVVTEAFERDGKKYVTYDNPWGVQQTVPYERFEKIWSNLKYDGIPTGYDKAYILIDRGNAPKLRPSNAFDLEASRGLAWGAASVANGVGDLKKGRIVRGLGRMVGGAVGAVTAAIGCIAAVPGRALQGLGDRWLGKAGDMLRSSNILTKVGGVFVGAGGAIVKGAGAVLTTVGNGIAQVGRKVGEGIASAASTVASAAESVFNVVKKY